MRVKTYDFRAFCRGELIRTNQSQVLWKLIDHLQGPVMVMQDGRRGTVIIHTYPYGFMTAPFFVPVVDVYDEEESQELLTHVRI